MDFKELLPLKSASLNLYVFFKGFYDQQDNRQQQESDAKIYTIEQIFGRSFPLSDDLKKAGTKSHNQEHFAFLQTIRKRPNLMAELCEGIQQGHQQSDSNMKERLKESEKLRIAGNELFERGEYEKAIVECYLKAINLTPNDGRLFNNCGLCCLKLAKQSKKSTEREKFVQEAMVYGFAASLLGNNFAKSWFIIYQVYDILDDNVAKENICMSFVDDEKSYGEFMKAVVRYNLEKLTQVENNERSANRFDHTDLKSVIDALFSRENKTNLMKQLFYLCHIVLCLHFNFVNCSKYGVGKVALLLQERFSKKLLQMPVFARLISNSLTLEELTFEESLFFQLGAKILEAIVNETGEEMAYPENFIGIFAYVAKSISDEDTMVKFNCKKIPFSDNLLKYFINIFLSIAREQQQLKLFYNKLAPLNPVEWLLSLPIVFFAMMNPKISYICFTDLFKAIFLAFRHIKEFFEYFEDKEFTGNLKSIYVGMASFGIVADNLFQKLKSLACQHDANCEIKQITQCYNSMVLQLTLASASKNNKIQILQNTPQLWLWLIHAIEIYRSKPTSLQELVLFFAKLLEPWSYNLENTSSDALFAQEPLLSMIMTAIAKLFTSDSGSWKGNVQPTTIIPFVARLFSVSRQFTMKFCQLVPVETYAIVQEIMVKGEFAHFYWHIIESADDNLIEKLLLLSNHRGFDSVKEVMYPAFFAIKNNNLMNGEDYSAFHGCRALIITFEQANRLALNGNGGLKKALENLFHEETGMKLIQEVLKHAMNWANTRKRDVDRFKTPERYVENLAKNMFGPNIRIRIPCEVMKDFKFKKKLDADMCFDADKIAAIVLQLISVWSQLDCRIPRIASQLRAKYNFKL